MSTTKRQKRMNGNECDTRHQTTLGLTIFSAMAAMHHPRSHGTFAFAFTFAWHTFTYTHIHIHTHTHTHMYVCTIAIAIAFAFRFRFAFTYSATVLALVLVQMPRSCVVNSELFALCCPSFLLPPPAFWQIVYTARKGVLTTILTCQIRQRINDCCVR